MCRRCWAAEKVRQNEPRVLTKEGFAEEVRQASAGAIWLWTIAGSTAVNSLASGWGHHIRIPFGLSTSGIADTILAGRESPEKRLVPVLIIAVLIVAFSYCGHHAKGLRRWPFIVGGILYAADSGFAIPPLIADIRLLNPSLHTLGPLLAVSFHIAGVFTLFNAAYRVSIIKRSLELSLAGQQASSSSAASPEGDKRDPM